MHYVNIYKFMQDICNIHKIILLFLDIAWLPFSRIEILICICY